MEAVFLVALVILVVIGLGALKVIAAVLNAFVSSMETHAREVQARGFEQAILKATGDPEIVQLMKWLREDLTPYASESRYLEKLKTVCAKPELALIAFKTVLNSEDKNSRYVGIRGLAYLKHTGGIAPLLEFYKAGGDLKDKALEAVIELSAMAPVKGEYGYHAIFMQILREPCDSDKVYAKIRHLKKLLTNAAMQVSRFSEEDFGTLIDWSIQYSDGLISSDDKYIRYAGEDFKKTIQSLRAQREKGGREHQWQEHMRQQQQAQRERAERERQWQEQMRREQEGQRTRYRANAERERQGQQQGIKWTSERATDFYKILQVDPSAEPEVITSAYRRLAAKYHPDVYKAPDATRKMQLLNEAYAVLSDPVKRKRYDESRLRS